MRTTGPQLAPSTQVDRTRRAVEQWRRMRRHASTPMPAALWPAAVGVARRQGIYSTARALRTDRGAPKTHLEAAGARPVR